MQLNRVLLHKYQFELPPVVKIVAVSYETIVSHLCEVVTWKQFFSPILFKFKQNYVHRLIPLFSFILMVESRFETRAIHEMADIES